jgi:type II secretory pathway pseudopilin PulG
MFLFHPLLLPPGKRRRRLLPRFFALLPRQQGGLFIETILAILICSVVGVGVLSGMQSLTRSGAKTEVQANVENIARNQMEYTLSQAYQAPPFTCPTIVPPSGYSVTCQAEIYVAGVSNVQHVVVTVTPTNGNPLVLTTVRTN